MGFIVAIGSAGGASERRFNPATDVHRWRLREAGEDTVVEVVSIQPPTYTGGDNTLPTVIPVVWKFQSSHRRTPVATVHGRD